MTTADLVCQACGAKPSEGARFCAACGVPLARDDVGAEYKQVTVMFADVVRSMDMAAVLDIERLREIMTDLVERAAAVIRRYGGMVEYNGDGVMALFGAPVALEDHAYRACLAALDIQQEADRLASEVQRTDRVDLRLRVGLNSGRVIAGKIGSGVLGYAATGETVGFAQRMESVATPGTVMVSAATARLVEDLMVLGEPQWVHIKGVEESVCVRRLLAGGGDRSGRGTQAHGGMVGRGWEMAALTAIVDRVISGRGEVVNVVGPPGIGKSRAAREVAAVAAGRGVEVFWSYCESHTSDVPFLAAARILRAGAGVAHLGVASARERLRTFVGPDADQQDLLLLDDLLGIGDPAAVLPPIDPDARRRRLLALITAVTLARTEPALYIIEDAHWIDAVSESMLAALLAVVPRAPVMVLITSRPEYGGVLIRLPWAQLIALGPLADSEAAVLVGELLGSDPSIAALGVLITEQAAGNPFFAEEMVRELAQRGVLAGERGKYVCQTDVGEVSVPATVEAAIEARIDQLSGPARRTLSAAAVIGTRFDADLLDALDVDAAFEELVAAELIDRMRLTSDAEFTFHHPLIHAVAYESQLKSDRAGLHRRLATAIQERTPESVEENAALIAGHLDAAGDLHAAYGWYMRAAGWSANRDRAAARLSWERACRIADKVSDDDATKVAMRIAPRAMLCATAWQAIQEGQGRFAELSDLCVASRDGFSLAIGMSGRLAELLYAGRSHEEPGLPAEQMALLESIGDPAPMIGLAAVAFNMWWDTGQFGEILRWSDRVIERAAGDPLKGAEYGGFGSPLAANLAWRSIARWWLGRPGWQQDMRDANVAARVSGDRTILGLVALWTYGVPLCHGVIRADDVAVTTVEEALNDAGGSSDATVAVITWGLGMALLSRNGAADRDRGLEVMMQAREKLLCVPMPFLVPIADLWIAREKAKRGDRDGVIPMMRTVVHDLHAAPRAFFGTWGAGVLVETLLERGTQDDIAEAQRVIAGMASLRAEGSAILEITRLRLCVLLARARGDEPYFRDLVNDYRTTAEALGYASHIDWAKAIAGGMQ